MRILNITLLGMAVIYTLMLTLFGGDVINYLQNIVMYLFPITNKIILDDKTGR